MPESEPLHDPEQILNTKDTILTAFRLLPPEQQATLGLVVLDLVMQGEWGAWFKDALTARFTVGENALVPPYIRTVRRADLAQTHLAEDEINQLSESDLGTIAKLIHEHFITDVFWDELDFISGLILEGKHRASDPASVALSAIPDNRERQAFASEEPIPVSWVGKEDFLQARPDLRDNIATLDHQTVARLADQVGDGLQETYALVVGLVLDRYFSEAGQESTE